MIKTLFYCPVAGGRSEVAGIDDDGRVKILDARKLPSLSKQNLAELVKAAVQWAERAE